MLLSVGERAYKDSHNSPLLDLVKSVKGQYKEFLGKYILYEYLKDTLVKRFII